MLADALRDRRVRRSLGVVAVAIVAIVIGGVATVTLVETNTFATLVLVFGAVFLLLVTTLMTLLVLFLRDLQSKATKLLEANPTGRDLGATHGLLASLRELDLGASAVRDASISPLDRVTRGRTERVAPEPAEPDSPGARDDPAS